MNEAQLRDLFTEWDLYEETAKRAIFNEYQKLRKNGGYDNLFLDFLKEKLEIEGYWKKVG
jgi:hypothetical protein